MTLEDMLDTLRRDILRDNADVVEGDDPRLWSDTTLIRYINEAQRVFAKTTLVLRSKFTIMSEPGVSEYPLDPAIFAVISAKWMGNSSYVGGVLTLNAGLPLNTVLVRPDQIDLGRTGHSQLETWQVPDSRWFDINLMNRLPPGKPLVYSTDEEVTDTGGMMMRLYPIPIDPYAPAPIQVRAVKTPTILSEDDMEAEPDLPVDYHMQILDYAAFRALKIVDAEAGNPQRAQEFKDEFDRNCEVARREMLRKMFTPQAWGFGHNGFSYVSN